MLCVKAEGFFGRTNKDEVKHEEHHNLEKREECEDLYNQTPFSPLNNIGNTIQRYLIKKQTNWKSRLSVSDSTSSSGSGTSSSGLDFMEQDGKVNVEQSGEDKNDSMQIHISRLEADDGKVNVEQSGEDKNDSMQIHISRLEADIKTMQTQLDEEINLHLALASASDNSTRPFSNPLCQLPDKAQYLLADINMLEVTIAKLEEELVALQFQLSQERNERRLVEYRLRHLPSSSLSLLNYTSVSPEIARPSNISGGMTLDDLLLQENAMEWRNHSYFQSLRQHPNQLSEEMVRCMRNIFLCLADSSEFSSSGCMASPQGHLSYSSATSPSGSPAIPASKQSLSFDFEHVFSGGENTFDPYRVLGKLNWTKYIGAYSVAAEVSWMSVGEKQLEYAAGALKRFRLLVEQLAKTNPSCMNTNERLAFWINLYNTLIMHAYLAYGVPSSDSKFFSLMKKASYTVRGLSLSAADIEYIILKMKPPSHRPHMALVLGLHKFKLLEEKRMYSIENLEPLVAFALSCGMHSSPAVRIFRPENVMAELQNSLKDYIRASVGINNKGKLIVPKLLHSYTKGIVEDSMLPEWICRFLSSEQTAMVRDSSSHNKQRLLSPRSFMIQPFDSRFRYLFLPESSPRCVNEGIKLN